MAVMTPRVSARLRRLLPIALGAVVVVATVVTVAPVRSCGGSRRCRPDRSSPPCCSPPVPLRQRPGAGARSPQASDCALSWRAAMAAYYRSQFLNTVLPGGVVGDAHRAYRHGRRAGAVAVAARAVATERLAGQVVQFVVVAIVLASLGLTAPLRGMAWVAAGLAIAVMLALTVAAATRAGRRALRRELGMLRRLLADPRRSLVIVLSSILVVVAHSATFVVACLAVGVHAPVSTLIALALVALSAASLPISLGGWGPREAASASAFALARLGAAAGLAASTAFGVLTMISVAPGAIVLIADRVTAARAGRTIPEERTA